MWLGPLALPACFMLVFSDRAPRYSVARPWPALINCLGNAFAMCYWYGPTLGHRLIADWAFGPCLDAVNMARPFGQWSYVDVARPLACDFY